MKIHFKCIVAFFCLFISAKVLAETQCQFRLDCQNGKDQFSFLFSSPSGECAEDDGQIFLEKSGKRTNLNVNPHWYSKIESLGNSPSVCRSEGVSYPAFPIDGGKILLFLKYSGRPGYDKIGAVLIDIASQKVLNNHVVELGETKDHYTAFLKTKAGYKLQVVKDYLKEVNCDCDAAFSDDWKEVFVEGNRIKTKWLGTK